MRKQIILSAATALMLTGIAHSPAVADPGGSVTVQSAKNSGNWAVLSGAYLKATLEGWCREAGWTLIWDSSSDYKLGASATFNDNFEGAVTKLIDSIYINNPELTATMFRGNRVLHIEEQSLTNN